MPSSGTMNTSPSLAFVDCEIDASAGAGGAEVQKANSTQPPAYLCWLRSPVIQQAIYEMSDTPRFIPGNHKRQV